MDNPPAAIFFGALPFLSSVGWCLTVLWGLGGLVPARQAGLRLAVGAAVLPLLMVGTNFALGLPLTVAAELVVGVALIVAAMGWRGGVMPPPAHPVWILPLLVAVLVLWRGGLSYQPYSWDEFSAWLYWPREAYLLNDGRAAAADWRSLGYTQGLVLATLFPNLFADRFDEVRQLAFPLLLHVAMLSVTFDFTASGVRDWWGMERRRAILVAWAVVLVLLAVEASWTLVPQLLQAEKPQVYLNVVILLLLAEAERRPERLRVNALIAGLALAAGFLVKSSFLAGVVPVGAAFVWLAWRGRRDERWAAAVVLALPLAAVLGWSWTKGSVGGACLGNPFAVFTTAAGDGRLPPHQMVAHLLGGVADYVLAYKPGLTLLAVLGLGLGLRGRSRATVLALAGMALIYLGSLYLVYSVCLNALEGEALASLPRYLRVPLRTIHTLGLIILVVETGIWLRTRWSGFADLAADRATLAALVVVLLCLMGWQVRATARALDNIATRSHERDRGAVQSRLARESEELAETARATGGGRIIMLAQGLVGEEFIYGRYYGLGRLRGAPTHRYTVEHEFSFASTRLTPWTTVLSAVEMSERLKEADILWPQRLDSWLTDILRPLLANPTCLDSVIGQVMVRQADGRFACRGLIVDEIAGGVLTH